MAGNESESSTGDLHSDHLTAHEGHAAWLKDLSRWRSEMGAR